MKNFDLSNDVVDFSINQGSPDFMHEKETVLANILIDHLNWTLDKIEAKKRSVLSKKG